MENEFDFFNNLNFGTDFTRQGLGGYGTFSGEYLDPTVTSPISTSPINTPPVLEGIQTAAPIDIIPAPVTPFINQGGDNDGGITTATKNYDIFTGDAMTFDGSGIGIGPGVDYEYEASIAPGLTGIQKATDYLSDPANYAYMAMNKIIPFSGTLAKKYVENKRRKEIEAEEKREQALKSFYERQQIQEDIDLSETDLNKAAEEGIAINPNEGIGTVNPNSVYGKSQGYVGGTYNPNTQTGWSGAVKSQEAKDNYDAGQAQAAANAAAAATRESYRDYSNRGNNGGDRSPASDFSDDTPGTPFARGGRIGYGTGGIVTL